MTLSFSCKKISEKDLLSCAFDLNKTQYSLLVFLLSHERFFSVQEISNKLGLDRTTVQKAMKMLLNKDLVQRAQENLENGGYTYFYKIKNKSEIKQRMKKLSFEWYKAVDKAIDNM
ncbi:MarR family transcriptional regulator [Candidatus Woesearchaeota archaeon]|nr:MAG: MarR family transcriptional regulator [Candidatus Woesearchaeota archaeon]